MTELTQPEILSIMPGAAVVMIGTTGMSKLHTVGLLTKCGKMITIIGDMEVSSETPL